VQRRISINSLGIVPLVATFALCLIAPAQAQSGDPIKIGVIAEVQSIAAPQPRAAHRSPARRSTPRAESSAARSRSSPTTTKGSSADSVRAFQQAVSEEKVAAGGLQRGNTHGVSLGWGAGWRVLNLAWRGQRHNIAHGMPPSNWRARALAPARLLLLIVDRDSFHFLPRGR
jgi:hypothetical protein